MNDICKDGQSLRITPPDKMLRPDEIVIELTRLLYGTDEPTQEMCDRGGTLTLTYDQFYCATGHKSAPPSLCYLVQEATWNEPGWWITIGFGTDNVLIGANSNYAPIT